MWISKSLHNWPIIELTKLVACLANLNQGLSGTVAAGSLPGIVRA